MAITEYECAKKAAPFSALPTSPCFHSGFRAVFAQ